MDLTELRSLAYKTMKLFKQLDSDDAKPISISTFELTPSESTWRYRLVASLLGTNLVLFERYTSQSPPTRKIECLDVSSQAWLGSISISGYSGEAEVSQPFIENEEYTYAIHWREPMDSSVQQPPSPTIVVVRICHKTDNTTFQEIYRHTLAEDAVHHDSLLSTIMCSPSVVIVAHIVKNSANLQILKVDPAGVKAVGIIPSMIGRTVGWSLQGCSDGKFCHLRCYISKINVVSIPISKILSKGFGTKDLPPIKNVHYADSPPYIFLTNPSMRGIYGVSFATEITQFYTSYPRIWTSMDDYSVCNIGIKRPPPIPPVYMLNHSRAHGMDLTSQSGTTALFILRQMQPPTWMSCLTHIQLLRFHKHRLQNQGHIYASTWKDGGTSGTKECRSD